MPKVNEMAIIREGFQRKWGSDRKLVGLERCRGGGVGVPGLRNSQRKGGSRSSSENGVAREEVPVKREKSGSKALKECGQFLRARGEPPCHF